MRCKWNRVQRFRGSGLWVVGCGFWVQGSGFWVLGSGLWVQRLLAVRFQVSGVRFQDEHQRIGKRLVSRVNLDLTEPLGCELRAERLVAGCADHVLEYAMNRIRRHHTSELAFIIADT